MPTIEHEIIARWNESQYAIAEAKSKLHDATESMKEAKADILNCYIKGNTYLVDNQGNISDIVINVNLRPRPNVKGQKRK